MSDKALSVFPMAYYFSAVEAFEKRIMAAQYYNADLAKIDLQYQQSRKKGGLPDQTGTALSTAE